MSEPLDNIRSTLIKEGEAPTVNEAKPKEVKGIIFKNISISTSSNDAQAIGKSEDSEEDEFKTALHTDSDEFVMVGHENHFGTNAIGGLSQAELDEIEDEDLEHAISSSLKDKTLSQQNDSASSAPRYPTRSRTSKKSDENNLSQKEIDEREREDFERAIAMSLRDQSLLQKNPTSQTFTSSSSAPMTFQYSNTPSAASSSHSIGSSQSHPPSHSSKTTPPPTP